MAANKRILFSRKRHLTKIWKTTFPKGFFNKIGLKVEEHEYIHIFETKYGKKNIV